MKLREAKQLIIDEMGVLLENTMSPKTEIQSYLVSGVKIGRITAQEAAAITIKDYENACTAIENDARNHA